MPLGAQRGATQAPGYGREQPAGSIAFDPATLSAVREILQVAGFGEFGPIRVRDNPMAASLLARYRHPVTSAVIA